MILWLLSLIWIGFSGRTSDSGLKNLRHGGSETPTGVFTAKVGYHLEYFIVSAYLQGIGFVESFVPSDVKESPRGRSTLQWNIYSNRLDRFHSIASGDGEERTKNTIAFIPAKGNADEISVLRLDFRS
jgi:hypothetical protein